MLMYNLLEYSDNYSMTLGSLWNYYRDAISDDNDENDGSEGKSFNYKTKIIGKTEVRPPQPAQPLSNLDRSQPLQSPQAQVPPLNTEVVIPLNYLSIFWRPLDLPLINYEIELGLSCSKNCLLLEEDNLINATFQINSTKHVLVVTLSINDNIKFLENIKQGFKRTVP